MQINKGKVLKLNDGKEYVVVSLINYNTDKYIFIVDINKNENFKICNLNQNKLIEVENVDLILELMKLFNEETKSIFMQNNNG